MAKALLINSTDKTVTEIECNGYRDMLPHLPGGIEIGWRWDNGDVMYVDSEAMLRPAAAAFKMKPDPKYMPVGATADDVQPYFGNGIVCGPERWDASKQHEVETDVRSTIAEVTSKFDFMDVGDAVRWFRRVGDRPAGSVTSFDPTGEVLSHAVTNEWSDFLPIIDPENQYV